MSVEQPWQWCAIVFKRHYSLQNWLNTAPLHGHFNMGRNPNDWFDLLLNIILFYIQNRIMGDINRLQCIKLFCVFFLWLWMCVGFLIWVIVCVDVHASLPGKHCYLHQRHPDFGSKAQIFSHGWEQWHWTFYVSPSLQSELEFYPRNEFRVRICGKCSALLGSCQNTWPSTRILQGFLIPLNT